MDAYLFIHNVLVLTQDVTSFNRWLQKGIFIWFHWGVLFIIYFFIIGIIYVTDVFTSITYLILVAV